MTYEAEVELARQAYLQDPFCRTKEQSLRDITGAYAGHVGAVNQDRLHQMYQKTIEESVSDDIFVASASKVQRDAIKPHLVIRGSRGDDLVFA